MTISSYTDDEHIMAQRNNRFTRLLILEMKLMMMIASYTEASSLLHLCLTENNSQDAAMDAMKKSLEAADTGPPPR